MSIRRMVVFFTAAALGLADNFHRIGVVRSERLFEQQILTGTQRGQRHLFMQIAGRRNDDHSDVLIVDQLAIVDVRCRRLGESLIGLRQLLWPHIGQGDNPAFRHIPQRRQMSGGAVAATDDADSRGFTRLHSRCAAHKQVPTCYFHFIMRISDRIKAQAVRKNILELRIRGEVHVPHASRHAHKKLLAPGTVQQHQFCSGQRRVALRLGIVQ